MSAGPWGGEASQAAVWLDTSGACRGQDRGRRRGHCTVRVCWPFIVSNVAQAGLGSLVLLPLPDKCWDNSCVPAHLAPVGLGSCVFRAGRWQGPTEMSLRLA